MTWIWVVLGVLAFIGIVALVLLALASCPTIDETKKAELDAIKARAVRANYELDRAAFAQRRAISDAIQKAQRDHHL
ncbi:hypothetical protein [Mesorhizobium japonicum]|uniref:hypothetical protein n=1 Tax=Mesorhizobium japonicum TaxID=2066070 RepID=UPI003B592F56